MPSLRSLLNLAASASLISSRAEPAKLKYRSSSNTPVVTVKGNAFWADGDRFYIRGVDYQPGGSSALQDPIADADGCKRDITYFKELGINTIRVYTVDNTADHDECMSLLSDAGIYLALDLNNPDYSINRADPGPSYNAKYLQSVFATVDAFADYDNTLLFFSGNEVINDGNTTDAAPYVKATTRDIKAYISARSYRSIPVGYSAADVDSNRYQMATYMNCGNDSVRSDFFAFNDYSWCDPSSYTISGWDQKVATYSNYSIPLFLSEYGCNINTRKFEEVASLYSTNMTPVYSGGLVYEYSQEVSDYGLVEISDNNVTLLPDFDYLKTAYEDTANPTGDGGAKTTDSGASACPTKSADWDVDGDTLPDMPSGAEVYMKNGAGTGPGLKGSSQSGGDSSSSSNDTTSTASSSATATAASGTSSASASATKTGAAAAVKPPSFSAGSMGMTFVVLFSTALGMSLL